jgi:alkaline phosphatase D
MHRSFLVGDLMQIVVLDTRVPGRDEHADHEGAPALDDPGRSLLGNDQRTWLSDRLADGSRPWTLLVTAVTLSPLKLPIADEDVPTLDAALPSGYAIVDGEALCTDEWDGYPAERDHLLTRLREHRGDTVVISGDIHSSWALEVRDEDGIVAAEFVCPSLTSTPMGHQLPAGARGLADDAADQMPHRRWAELRSNGWLHLTITSRAVRADWFAVSCEEPADPRSAADEPLASWVARPGPPITLQPASAALAPWPDRRAVAPEWLPPRPQAVRTSRRRWRLVAAGSAALVATAAVAVALRCRKRR